MRLPPIVPLNWCTDRCKARFTLIPKFSFCTATSIKATASSFNAAAVASIRVSQCASCLFIAVEQHQYLAQAFASDPELASQPHPTNATYGPQVVLIKYFICRLFYRLLRYINAWVFIVLVFQIIFDISQELVIFGEYRNDGNLKSDVLQTVTSVHDDSPF